VIQSFRHRGLKALYEKGDRSRLSAGMVPKIERVLTILDSAATVQELDLPGLRLHPLKGEKQEFWSVTISGNWRIIFRFVNGDAFEVELIDYH
jgi:proteic killer suppression protein